MAARMARPLPRPRSSITRAPAERARAPVPSDDPPSITRTSSAWRRAPRTTSAMVAASFFAGMRTVMRPLSGTARAALLLPEGNELDDSALFEFLDRRPLLLGRGVDDELPDPFGLLVDDGEGAGRGGGEGNGIAPRAGGLELVVHGPDVVLEDVDVRLRHREGRAELDSVEGHVAPVEGLLLLRAEVGPDALDLSVVEDVGANPGILFRRRALDGLMVDRRLLGQSKGPKQRERSEDAERYESRHCHRMVFLNLASPMRVTTASMLPCFCSSLHVPRV